MHSRNFHRTINSFITALFFISVLAFAACGGGGSTNVQTENGTNKISADAGGTVTYNSAVKLSIPANSLSEDVEIVIETVNNAPSTGADTLLPAGQAYRFTPAGTTFSLNKPAVAEFTYDESVLAQKGYSVDTLQLYYYGETLKEYVVVAGYVDKTNKKIIAYIEHFTIYMPMAKVKLTTNNSPYVAIQNPIPNPVRADAPIYVRATASDYDGSLAGVKLYYRKLQPTAGSWNEVIMEREVRPENTTDTYTYLIPGTFLTSADLGTILCCCNRQPRSRDNKYNKAP